MEPLSPALFNVRLPAGTGDALRPGATYSARVAADANGQTFVRVAGQRLPLPEGATLPPGTRVAVSIPRGGEAAQIRMAHAPPQSTAAGAPTPGNALGALVQQLGQLAGGLRADQAVALLPPQLPADAALVRTVLTLLAQPGSSGGDLAALVRLAQAAEQAGMLRGGTAAALAAWQWPEAGAGVQTWRRWLERMQQARTPTAALAKLSGETPGDLRTLLMHLTQDEALRTWLAQQGETETFERAAGRLTQRLTASEAQQLHGLERPYAFLDLPVRLLDGFRHGQVHFLNEGAAASGEGMTRVVLDLDLTNLGPVWVALSCRGSACQCAVRALPQAQAALAEDGETLRAALASAGYQAAVRVEAWDGNRVDALAALLQPPAGLDTHT